MTKLLNEGIKKQVKDVLKEMQEPVSIHFFDSTTINCDYCKQTLQLLEEVVELDSRLHLFQYDLDQDAALAKEHCIDKVPAFILSTSDGKPFIDSGIRFYGIPAGSEFTTLINDLIMVSKRDSGLNRETREFLASLKAPLHLQVFVTPT